MADCRNNRGIDTPFRIVESPDGEFIYLASVFSNAVTAYRRAAGGELTIMAGVKGRAFANDFETCTNFPGLNGPQGLAISPDGRFLYAVSINDHTITPLRRDTAAPTCQDGAATVPGGTAATLTLACSDADGDPLTISIVTSPAGSILGAVDQTNRTVSVIAGQAATATSPTFKATSNGLDSNVATFNLTITAAPPPPPPAQCLPKPEIAGNGIDEDCSGADLPLPGPVLPEVTAGTVRPFWTTFARYTLLRQLRISAISAGAKVEIRCSGGKKRGCPFARRTFTPNKGAVNASKPFRRRKLRRKAKIEVRITKPGAIGKVVTYTIARRKVPRGRVRCLPVGATKPAAC